ncbi:MAG: MFS transporter, partial [Pseudomonadaceae bacterium]|nr:MFS transporter [Pseudomonadaceae bacterium]
KAVLRDHRPAIVLSMLLTWVLSAAIVVLILLTPSVLQSAFGFAPALTLQANSLAIVCLSVGCIVAGLLADRFGAGRVLMFGSLLLASAAWIFYSHMAARPDLLLPLYALTGLAVGMIGAIPLVLVQAFPAAIRFSGLSFSYNLAYAIFGGLTPMAVAFLLKYSALGPAYYVVALCLLGLAIGFYLRRLERVV